MLKIDIWNNLMNYHNCTSIYWYYEEPMLSFNINILMHIQLYGPVVDTLIIETNT